jgi:hypothetical protein
MTVPTVLHLKLSLLFFLAKKEKPCPMVPHLRLSFITSWEKPTPCAAILGASSVLEEVEGYKNNFIFSQDS